MKMCCIWLGMCGNHGLLVCMSPCAGRVACVTVHCVIRAIPAPFSLPRLVLCPLPWPISFHDCLFHTLYTVAWQRAACLPNLQNDCDVINFPYL